MALGRVSQRIPASTPQPGVQAIPGDGLLKMKLNFQSYQLPQRSTRTSMPETPPEYIAFPKERRMPRSILKIAPEILFFCLVIGPDGEVAVWGVPFSGWALLISPAGRVTQLPPHLTVPGL